MREPARNFILIPYSDVDGESEKMDDSFLDSGVSGENIFQTNEASEGMKRQAEALGISPESVDLNKEQKVLYAKKNCNKCYGRGVITLVPSPCKPKKIKVNLKSAIEKRVRDERVFKVGKGKLKRTHKKPTQKRARVQTELPGNALGEVWNTRRREPFGVKRELRQDIPCSCVRVLEI